MAPSLDKLSLKKHGFTHQSHRRRRPAVADDLPGNVSLNLVEGQILPWKQQK